MGQHHALGMTRRTRRIHDREIVFWPDIDIGPIRPKPRGAKIGISFNAKGFAIADTDQIRPITDLQQAFNPGTIGKDHRRMAILYGIIQLFNRPPGIDEHHHGAGRRDRHEQDQHLGTIPHRQRDPFTFADAALLHGQGQRADIVTIGVIGLNLILIDQVFGFAIVMRRACALHQIA